MWPRAEGRARGCRFAAVPALPPLPQERRPRADALVPALVASIAWGLLAMAADEPIATQRSLVFLGGPLLLLAGLHARLFPYLHAPDRMRWLPLAIPPGRHWQAAGRGHWGALVWSSALGFAAILLADPGDNLVLAIEFLWLCAFAVLLEPTIAGVGAALGRRFPEHSPLSEAQRSLGGGWTTPEAVIHLYGPALGIGVATLLAMPGQLGLERWADGSPPTAGHVTLGLAPLVLAIGIRLVGPRAYRAGLFEAVPWLAEATKTLAGAPTPEPSPAWVARVRDPWSRLLILQFLRMTPLPGLRAVIVLATIAYLAVRADPPTGPAIAFAATACGLWVAPARSVRAQADNRARLAGALPLPAAHRRGRAGWVTLLLWAPVLAFATVLAARLAG